MRISLRLGMVVAALMMVGLTAQAQLTDNKPLGSSAEQLPSYLKDAGIVERLNERLPLETTFADETGKAVSLGSLFQGRPVALALVYFKCGMLCPQVLHGMERGLKESGFTVGKDFDVIVASIDPMDTPADASKAKLDYLAELGQDGPRAQGSVHFLTGQAPAIAALSQATGFHYVRVPGPDGKMDQFAHSSVVMFATPEGRLSEYLSGIDYPARDVRLALVNASHRKIASVRDLVLLYCCNYVPSSGRYTVAVLRLLSFAALVTLIGGGIGLYFLTHRKRPQNLAT